MSEVVGFSCRRTIQPDGGNWNGLDHLFSMLRERGLNPVLLPDMEDAFFGGAVYAQQLEGETGIGAKIQVVDLGEVGALYNRMDRSYDRDALAANNVRYEDLPAVLNANQTRSLGFRKINMYDRVLAPLGEGIPTTLLTPDSDPAAFADLHPADYYIAKPNSGTNGTGVRRVARAALDGLLESDSSLAGAYILQPAYDFTHAIPGIRPYDQASAEAVERGNAEGVVKEVRVYVIHSPEGTDVLPVGRAHPGTEDDGWFFVDPDSMDQEMLRRAGAIIQRVALESHAPAVLGTVDFGFDNIRPEDDLSSVVVEANVKMPYWVRFNEHPTVAKLLRTMIADQALATVQSGARSVVK